MKNPNIVALKLMGIEVSCRLCAHSNRRFTVIREGELTPILRSYCGSRNKTEPINKAPNCPGFAPKQYLIRQILEGKENAPAQ